MRVAILTPERAKALGVPFNSPTAVTGWLECPRKWAFRYIAKIYAPSTASADLGTDAHKQLELYLTEAKPLDFSRPSGDILQAGLHLFPEPKTPGLKGEGEFYLRSERTGHVYMGKKDVELPPGVPQPQLGFDGSAPIIEDLKTTSSIADYAKNEDDLRFDPQAGLYAIDAMVRYDAPFADLGWIYCQTKKTKKSHPVAFRMHKHAAERLFDAVETVADEMQAARDGAKGHDPIEFVRSLPPNPAACRAFSGCPHQHVCNLSPSQKARAQMSGNALIASLRNRVQGQGTSTPASDPKQLPLPNVPSAPTPEQEIPEALKHPYVPKSAEGAVTLGLPFPAAPSAPNDPINPPESLLPPAPLPEKASAEDDKPKKERKPRTSKKDAEAKPAEPTMLLGRDVVGFDGPAPTVQSDPVTPVVTVSEDKPSTSHLGKHYTPENAPADAPTHRIVDSVPAAASSFTLYVDCIPIGRKVVEADALIEEANTIVVERQKGTDEPVDHYSFIGFGKSKGAIALALEEVLDNHPELVAVFCSSVSDALPTLTKRAGSIVRGIR